jgi:hypothetical protein
MHARMKLGTSTFALALLVVGCSDTELAPAHVGACTADAGARGMDVLSCPVGSNGMPGATGSQGATGADGLAALIRLDAELPGTHCPNGGTAVQSGLDLDDDQELDDDEITGTTQYVCSGVSPVVTTSIEGSFTLRNSLDAALLASVTQITGDLVIAAPGLVGLSLPSLTQVGGYLKIESNDELVAVSAPNLTAARAVQITGNAKLTSIDADLSVVVALLNVSDNAELTTFAGLGNLGGASVLLVRDNAKLATLAGLTRVPSVDTLELARNPLLSDLSALSALTTVTGDLTISQNGALDSSGFSSLASVGSLSILGNPLLAEISFPALTTVTNGIVISENPLLATLSDWSSLSSVGGHFLIENNGGAVTPYSGPILVGDVQGSLVVAGNAELTMVADFPALHSIGTDLFLQNNPKLSRIDLSAVESLAFGLRFESNAQLASFALPALETAGFYVFISENPALLSFDLRALSAVPDTLNVYDNSLLPQCLVAQLQGQLTSPPQNTFFSGNDNAAVCPP